MNNQLTTNRQLPKITPRQQDILTYLYLFRFLTRTQIQNLIGHKDKHRINAWLHDLMRKHYIEGTYSKTIWHINQPAVYNLGLLGIRYFKSLAESSPQVLSRIYRDNTRSEEFISRCLTTADIAIQLINASTPEHGYDLATASDYADPTSSAHFLADSPIAPDLLVISRTAQSKQPYFIEVMPATLPPYKLRSATLHYVNFCDNGTWQEQTGEPFPPVIFVTTNTQQLFQTKRFAKSLLAQRNISDIRIDFITRRDLDSDGIIQTLEFLEPK
jgi:Replication-relaxation